MVALVQDVDGFVGTALSLAVQPSDHAVDLGLLKPGHHVVDRVLDGDSDFLRHLFSISLGLVDDVIEIVDGQQRDAVDLGEGRVDVPGQGQIDEQQRLVQCREGFAF